MRSSAVRLMFLVAYVCGTTARAGTITFAGLITQSTPDGTGPAANNPALNNIADGDSYALTLNFAGSIGTPGSFNPLTGAAKLSSNLVVPDAATTAIVINADSVTIDLNGFSLLGPVDCSAGFSPCAGVGKGGNAHGITTNLTKVNITIRNGTVQGFGGTGIFLSGDSFLVEYLHIRSNDGYGMYINNGTLAPSGFPISVTMRLCSTVIYNTIATPEHSLTVAW